MSFSVSFAKKIKKKKKLLTGAEGRGLSRPGLGLLDHVEALGERHDALLLDRGGLLETVLESSLFF